MLTPSLTLAIDKVAAAYGNAGDAGVDPESRAGELIDLITRNRQD